MSKSYGVVFSEVLALLQDLMQQVAGESRRVPPEPPHLLQQKQEASGEPRRRLAGRRPASQVASGRSIWEPRRVCNACRTTTSPWVATPTEYVLKFTFKPYTSFA